MRAPKFWDNSPKAPGLKARLLQPLGAIYAKATASRVAKPASHRAKVPVICVGNINAGGVGKTPTVMALIERLSSRQLKVHVVTRGYGGSAKGPLRVNEMSHSAETVGDEPLLMAPFAPVWVAKDRAEGVRAAEAAGAEIILLDDGFQNPAVHKDLSIVVVDADQGFGNGLCLPAGPLREPVANGLSRADLALSIGSPEAQAKFESLWGKALGALPHLKGELKPLQMGMDWQDEPVLAFAGIGNPEKFFRTLRAEGAKILRAEPLDDHQPLSPALMSRLEMEAFALGAQLVTTEKDAARLPQHWRMKVLTLVVRLSIEDWQPLDKLLDQMKKGA